MKLKALAPEHGKERRWLERCSQMQDAARRQPASGSHDSDERLAAAAEILADIEVNDLRRVEFGEGRHWLSGMNRHDVKLVARPPE
jgi:hypothetical protein